MLVTGATGRVGRLVIEELLRAGVPARALTRRPEESALPDGTEVVAGDFTDPASLDAALLGVGTVFLVWTPAATTAPDVIARIADAGAHPRRVVYLSAAVDATLSEAIVSRGTSMRRIVFAGDAVVCGAVMRGYVSHSSPLSAQRRWENCQSGA